MGNRVCYEHIQLDQTDEYEKCKFFVERYPCCRSAAGHNCCDFPWWNDLIRWKDLDLPPNPVIIEVGGILTLKIKFQADSRRQHRV